MTPGGDVGTHIAICDDAPDLRLLMTLALTRDGHEVSCFEGGRQTLAALCSASPLPDLLLLDVQMPEMDGWTVLEQLRGDARFDSLRILMCTVKFSQADLIQAWELGCDGYLTKPFDLDELSDTVTTVLARSAAENADFRDEQQSVLTSPLGA